MNPVFQLKQTTLQLIVLLSLGCCVAAPFARAVFPPPDGGYPNGNTAEGQNELFSLTTGSFNTAVGYLSLRSNSEKAWQIDSLWINRLTKA
jgi:hypothetical protein